MSETSSKDNVKTAMTYICGGKLSGTPYFKRKTTFQKHAHGC